MKVLIDSNALHEDQTMVRQSSQRILELLGPAQAVLVFSPVVLAELKRQRLEKVDALEKEAASRLQKLGRLASPNVSVSMLEVREAAAEVKRLCEERWVELLNLPNVELGAWPKIDSRTMTERELERRRPFLDRDHGTIGHRDTLIWLGVVELLREADEEEVVFVTADQGFLDRSELHPDLVADLETDEHERLTVLQDLNQLIELLLVSASNALRNWREQAIENAIAEAITSLDASDFTPTFDAREGDDVARRFDIGLPRTGHDWTLDYVEGPLALKIPDTSAGDGVVSCEFDVEPTLTGFMDKWEWYGGEHPGLTLWDGDWNDHLVAVEASPVVHMSVNIRVSNDEHSVEFLDFTAAESDSQRGASFIAG